MRIEAGRFRGRSLPRARGARPVSGRLRRSLFGVLASRIAGARVLDLFAGIGAMGLEALSRGAGEVVLVEKDVRAVTALRRWIEAAGAAGEARAVRLDLLGGKFPTGPFDLVLLDPPYGLWERPEVSAALLARAVGVLAPGGLVVLKLPGRQAVPEDVRWRLAERREVGSAAWALVEATSRPDRT